MEAHPSKAAKANGAAIHINNKVDRKMACRVTSIRIDDAVEVATRNGWLCFWVGGREIRIGPLTPEQAEKLAEDLGYDAVRE
jgi:hypothetical protein